MARIRILPRDIQPGDVIDRMNHDIEIVPATVEKVVKVHARPGHTAYKVYFDRSDVPENRWPWAEYNHLKPCIFQARSHLDVERPEA